MDKDSWSPFAQTRVQIVCLLRGFSVNMFSVQEQSVSVGDMDLSHNLETFAQLHELGIQAVV